MRAAETLRPSTLTAQIGSLVDSKHTIAIAALAAFVLRLPGLTRPIRADEAGFLLVARSWDPQPDSMFGPYFVDRPPSLIALFRFSDLLGGPHFIRVVGALACALLVVSAAQTARLIADDRSARWTAVAMAAITANPLIDIVAVKGELLGLPFVMGACWLALLALKHGSLWYAAGAGLLAGAAMGFKQNLVGGLVFCGVLLIASWLTGKVTRAEFARLSAAGLAGAAVPVLGTVVWALMEGVRLHTMSYAIYGFRSDAARVIAEGSAHAPTHRAWVMVSIALAAGPALMIGGFLVHIRGEWADDRAITAATLAILLVDGAALVAGASFWNDYLFALLPGTALCVALLARRASKRGRAMQVVIAGAALSSAACLVGWLGYNAAGNQEFDEVHTGEALADSAVPGDTLVVFGGRADAQFASGLPSPYRFLWSLPMRTLDPDLTDLRAVIEGRDAPTWIVEWVPFDTWSDEGGDALGRLVDERYVEHGSACGNDDRTVFLLRGVERPLVEPECPAEGER